MKENFIASLAPTMSTKPCLYSNANIVTTYQNREATKVGDCVSDTELLLKPESENDLQTIY